MFKMTGRPERADDYYDQSIMALIYYNETQVLIENNRYRMISHFEREGFSHLLKLEPVPLEKISKRGTNRYGIRKNNTTVVQMEREINEYTDERCNLIEDLSLLEEFSKYGEENTDQVIAFGWALVSLNDSMQDPKNQPKAPSDEPAYETRMIRDARGNPIRVKVKV